MSVNVNFCTLTLVEDGIVLGLKNNKKKQILFSELDKIYMKVNRLKPVYEFMFIVFPFFFILLAIQYVMLEKLVFMALFTVVPVCVKTFSYKKNRLVVRLKEGTVFSKNVSLRSKTDNIVVVNTVKRALVSYNLKSRQWNDILS